MAWYDFITGKDRIDEATKAFKNKGEDAITDKEWKQLSGEGVEDVNLLQMWGTQGILGQNSFFNTFINKTFESEANRISEYRRMAEYPEVGDVIEDAANEACQPNDDLNLISLNFTDEKLQNNDNIRKTINREFNNLFFERIGINDKLWDMFRSFLIDGRLYYERVVDPNNTKRGIISIKKLPAETMDYELNPINGRVTTFYQYIAPSMKRPLNRQEAEKMKLQYKDNLVIFNPEQIGFINYGLFGKTQYEVLGFLEKAKVPYNQLKLIETSIIIYRLVRSPQRFVFKIDTGAMPRDKAMKYVEKIKNKFIKRQTYDPRSGNLSNEPEVLSLLENFFIPTSSDGKGSSIDTIGGDSKGFTELDDLYYFSRKLYRALKYPISRVTQGAEKGEEVMFGGSNSGQISRDEVKWAKFLERQQRIFSDEFLKLFLLHLEFRGMKNEYNLDYNSFSINMNPPSHYQESMEQGFREQEFANYNQLKDSTEFSKTFMIKKYLKWTEKDFDDNKKGFELDKKYFQQDNAPQMGGFNDQGGDMDQGNQAGQNSNNTGEVI